MSEHQLEIHDVDEWHALATHCRVTIATAATICSLCGGVFAASLGSTDAHSGRANALSLFIETKHSLDASARTIPVLHSR